MTLKSLVAVALSLAVLPVMADDAQPRAAADAPLTIHLVSGSGEYKSESSLREFSKFLQDNYRITCTASWGRDGAGELDNLEALKSAELMVVFARRMKLDEVQMRVIRSHWEQGKPIIGIRTAGHAFQKADNEVFDRRVLGGNYQGHYGNESVQVVNVPESGGHPVLKGVGPFNSAKLYKAGELAEGTIVLQEGDIGKARHPVSIAHSYQGGRTFFTSLGVPEDFQNKQFRRMLENAVFWVTHRDREKMQK